MPVITWVRTGTDNQKFKLEKAVLPDTATVTSSSSSNEIAPESSSSGTDAIGARDIRRDMQAPARKGYRDLKGRHFEKQIRYRVMF